MKTMKFDPEGETFLRCWFSPLEAKIMERVWKNPKKEYEQVTFINSLSHSRAYQTWSTCITRLMEKGILIKSPKRRSKYNDKHHPYSSFVYFRASCTLDEFIKSQVIEITSRLFRELNNIQVIHNGHGDIIELLGDLKDGNT